MLAKAYGAALNVCNSEPEDVQKAVAALKKAWQGLNASFAVSTRPPQYSSHIEDRQTCQICQLEVLSALYKKNREQLTPKKGGAPYFFTKMSSLRRWAFRSMIPCE